MVQATSSASDATKAADPIAESGQEKLSDEDMQRVKKYLSSPIHSVERKPFRPWLLIAGVWVLIVVLGLMSWAISYFALM